jgi:hypothetical protein
MAVNPRYIEVEPTAKYSMKLYHTLQTMRVSDVMLVGLYRTDSNAVKPDIVTEYQRTWIIFRFRSG